MTNTSTWKVDYRAALREFIERKGKAVEFRDDYGYQEVSTYGWTDHDAQWHKVKGCAWVVPEGATLVEKTYNQFQDTFSDNLDEVGVNVYPAHCACGKYTDMTLRYVGSFGDVLKGVLKIDGYKPEIQL